VFIQQMLAEYNLSCSCVQHFWACTVRHVQFLGAKILTKYAFFFIHLVFLSIINTTHAVFLKHHWYDIYLGIILHTAGLWKS